VEITVRDNFDRFASMLTNAEREHLPFATALALNATARQVKADLIQGMKGAFDRPTPFTLNSLFISPATKAAPVAQVYFKDYAPKGTPAGKYLAPQIEGGARRQKAMERKLSSVLGGRAIFLAPSKRTQLDGYGNPNRGQMTTILTRLAPGTLGLGRANSGKGKRRKEAFFAIAPGRNAGGLPVGIYQRKGREVIPVLTIAKAAPKYSRRFDFFGIGLRSIAANLDKMLPPALEKALRSSRR